MPILKVAIVAPVIDFARPADLAQSLADATAQVFGAAKGTVWVKLQIIRPAYYAEDGGKPEGVNPVFVRVLKSRAPEGSELKDEVAQLIKAIASVLNRPGENVHLFNQPNGAGRITLGGKLVD